MSKRTKQEAPYKCGLAALAVQRGVDGSRMLELRWLIWLGRVSYGLYLWHNILIHLPWPGPDLAIGLLASIVITWLSWTAIETPFLRLKDRPVMSPPQAAALDSDPINQVAAS